MTNKKDRWRVEFQGLAYDGGGLASWSKWYHTKIGAYFSMYWNLYVASWGGTAALYDKKKHKFLRKVDY